jgi:hypothetical protein
MKRRIEDEELLADVLAENEQGRATTLDHGIATLRRVRSRRRTARLMLSVTAPLVIMVVILMIQSRHSKAGLTSKPIAPPVQMVKTIKGTSIRILSDEELLDLFKDRPVALVGAPGDQQLLFLDEKN